MINVGIIGCGTIARQRHAVEYFNNPEAKIVGFFDLNEPRAFAMTEEFGGKVYSTAKDMIEDPAIDAVSICVANAYHAALTIEALEHGKHVLCEKPMAITLKDCEAMVAAAEKNGKHLLIDHNQRLASAHVKAKQILDSGELGKIISFSTVFGHKGPEMWSVDKGSNTWFFKKDTAAFGSMADLGIHKIDLIRYLVGSEVQSVFSDLAVLNKKFSDGSPIEVDDNSIEIIKFKNGVMGTVTTSWTYYGEESNGTLLYCEKGILRLYINNQYPLTISFADQTKAFYELKQLQSNDDKQQSTSGVIDLFVDSIKYDTKTILDASEAIESMRVVFACLESADSGQVVHLTTNNE